jgi:predicted anti-sigma-YlaC factor YlaD
VADLPTPSASCTPTREALSADLDGEVGALDLHEARSHAAACDPCDRFARSLATVNRHVRVAAADPVPDLTAPILVALAEDRSSLRDRRSRDLRVLVGMAGVVQLVLALPVLFGAWTPALHLGRDLGALELALGVGFLLAAYQPHRAAGVLPIAAAAFAVVTVAAGVDLVAGRAAIVSELTHLTELVGVVALWGLTRRLPDAPTLRLRPVGTT